ncbi:MAG: SpoIID/LytB domain-containing protein [Micrococcales bacterium]|nr:SpoIID/LytB domain-containing protein [Micrococcales bacterium]
MSHARRWRAPGALLVALVAVLATAVPATAAGPDWTVRGSGWGHGIGMSQYGAMEMARDGYGAAQILGHYYTGTTYDAVADTAVVFVNLKGGVTSTALSSRALSTGGGTIRLTAGSTSQAMTLPLGAAVTVTRSGASVRATCTSCSPATTITGTYVQAVWNDGRTLLTVDGTPYKSGVLVIWPTTSSATLQVVNKVRVHDEYLDYIREVPWSWPVEALKAQAAAARGYALSQTYKAACYCHLYDDTRSQVYGGYPTASGDLAAWPNWTKAVRATGTTTTGYVARYGGKIISAYYASSSGGRTQNNEDVWGGSAVPYLRSVSDPWSLRPSNPNRLWSTTVSGASLASAFGLPDVARLDLRDRTAGRGVDVARATSSAGAVATLDGERMRSVLGLKSTVVRHDATRLGGADRYAVAGAVAARLYPAATAAVLASGDGNAVFDACVAGPLSSTVGGPLLLSYRDSLPAATRAQLDARAATLRDVYVVGGPGSVSEAVVAEVESRYPGVTVHRLGGRNRFAVSQNVAAEIRSRRATPTVVVASSAGVADALGSSGVAAALYYPILLTAPTSVPPETVAALDASGARIAHIVGGTASVGPEVESYLATTRGMTVRRHGGADRYEVSANVATYFRPAFASVGEIVMSSGTAFADALAAGSLRRIMVLTARTGVPEGAMKVLQTTPELQTITVVGGPASVPDARITQARES